MVDAIQIRNQRADLSAKRPKPEGDTALLTIINAVALVATSAHGGVQVVAVVALLIMGAMLLVHGDRS
jgi:hypothetical protein